MQQLDRSDNIMAYNGVEMASAGKYGADADQTAEAHEFIQENDELDAEELLQNIIDDAEQRCKAWYNQNIADLLNPMPESEDNFDDKPVAWKYESVVWVYRTCIERRIIIFDLFFFEPFEVFV